MNNGWVKLHRGILEWEWYDDINTSRLFLHLLIIANHKDKNWRGILIKKGQKLTSQIKLADETGLTRQQVRTSLDKLKSTNDITITTSAQNTVVTVVNWDNYQDQPTDQPTSNQLVTNEQPTDNQRVTTNKNDKNEKNVINTILIESGMTQIQADEFVRIRKVNKGGKLTERVANAMIEQFKLATKIGWQLDDSLTEWETRGWKAFKSEWLTSKLLGAPNETNQRPIADRPDNSSTGRQHHNLTN